MSGDTLEPVRRPLLIQINAKCSLSLNSGLEVKWFHGHLPDFLVWNSASVSASKEAARYMKEWYVKRFNLDWINWRC